MPTELKGPFGGINQFMCTVGCLIPSLMALAIPNDPEENLNDWLVTGYWRIIWSSAILLSFL